MPTAKNPAVPEFYVYAFEVGSVPLYVGIGRDARASDRLNHVRRLLRRESQGRPVRWVLSNRVLAHFLQRNMDVACRFLHRGKTRTEALKLERHEIGRLLSEGFVLCNLQHNPNRPSTPQEVVTSVLSRACIENVDCPPLVARNHPEAIKHRKAVPQLSDDTVLVANSERRAKPRSFFALLQEAATTPITLTNLISRVSLTYKPPSSTKPAAYVIAVRTRYAVKAGFLKRHEAKLTTKASVTGKN